MSTMFVDNVNETAERKRFESFKLGGGLPSGMTPSHSHKRSHSRSHSRNISVSLSGPNAFPPPKPTSPELEQSSTLQPSNKRHSHHKRRSSVSTRTESAELMGITIPNLTSPADDNVNLGEKDSIRRRALWALEGKPDLSFTKVEIPELSDSASEKASFDFSTKSSSGPNGMPNFGPGLMTTKRDSFKLLAASSSSKDQLGTLIEEEEEEDEHPKSGETSKAKSEASIVDPEHSAPVKTVSRPRPATLNLKPLSLTPDTLSTNAAPAHLPTPANTPSPQLSHKELNTSEDSTTVTTTKDETKSRPPLNIKITSGESRRSSLPMSPEDVKATRRSSIGYKTSSNGVATNFAGLPTPEITPTSFERRFSLTDPLRRASSSTSASNDDEVFTNHPTQSRPLSASEQHFLVKSHNALLARITDLERALSMRRMSSGGYSNTSSSRPVSMVSELSSSSDTGSAEPNDEMLMLVADLKSERDELKRDVDGWRTRVSDMEKQLSIVAARVDSERRDAWVARSMSGLLEVEKRTVERKLEVAEKSIADLQNDKDQLTQENTELKDKLRALEAELEQARKMNASKAQDRHRLPPLEFTMKRFTSVDSGSSTTDVEDLAEGSPKAVFELRSVTEEEESFSDEDNGLAGYEDEDDSDPDMTFRSSSSFDSESPRSTTHLELDVPVSVKAEATPIITVEAPEIKAPRPTHAKRASLSQTWTFPRGAQAASAPQNDAIASFFDYSRDDESDGSRSPSSPFDYSFEKSKGLFSAGLKSSEEDDASPFFLPSGVGSDSGKLDVVLEEEEDDDEDDFSFGSVGGIQITFTPPQEEDDKGMDILRSSATTLGLPDEEESFTSFNFGRPIVAPPTPPSPETPPRVVRSMPMATPPSSRPSSASSPSSIPRSIALRKASPASNSAVSPPKFSVRTPSPSGSPSKRSGPPPSFIPQPKSSSPMRRVSNPIQVTRMQTPTQGLRKPVVRSMTLPTEISSGNGYGSNPARQPMRTNHPSYRSRHAIPVRRASSEIKSIDLSDPTANFSLSTPNTASSSNLSSIGLAADADMTPKASGLLSASLSSFVPSPRLTFQTFTSFIPSPWSSTQPNVVPSPMTNAPAVADAKRNFVSKEAQLEKLRIRLAREGSLKMKTSVNVSSCKRCDHENVSL